MQIAAQAAIPGTLAGYASLGKKISLHQKDLHIETLRGIAIVLVVLGHIIGYTEDGGLRVGDNSVLRYLYEWIDFFQLPLFTVISGWVYAIKPINDSTLIKRFIKGKARRLLVPMFVVSTILFLFRTVIPGTNHHTQLGYLPLNLVFPYGLYWFLYSLFLIFVLTSVLDATKWFHKFNYWIICVGVAVLAALVSYNYFDSLPNYFGYKGALYLMPFFLLGIGFLRYKQVVFTRKHLLWAAILFAISVGAEQIIQFTTHHPAPRQSVTAFILGGTSMFLLFRMPLKHKLLVQIGGAAYAIYLFHVFFTGGIRMIMYHLGIRQKFIVIIVSLGIAILVPMLIKNFVKKYKHLRLLFLGLK